MAADVFISYKSDEEEYARKIRSVLEANGISCWMAPDSIPLGSNYMKQIPLAIDGCRVMIILLSEKSQNSVWVKNEFSQAVTKNKLIIPYVIQDCPLQDEFAFSMSTMQQVYAYKDEQAAMEKVVHDIREALGKENPPNVQINIVAPPKKTNPMPYVLAALAVLLVIVGLFFFLKKPAEPAAAVRENISVYYSEVIPYMLAGQYATAEEAKADWFEFPGYDKAFSLLSFIRNDSGKAVFAEKIACDILSLSPVQVPVLRTDGLMSGTMVAAFVYNDGWGDAENIQAKWYVLWGDGVPEFPSFEEPLKGEKTLSVASGLAGEIFRTETDKEELLAWARENREMSEATLCTIVAEAACGESISYLAMYVMYDAEADDLIAVYGGITDEKPTITLFAVLDVDNPPEELRFYTGDNTPLVEDVFRIETVVIPTKSCNVSFRGKYLLGGKEYTTEPYSVSVNVPRFREDAYMLAGPLTRELFKINLKDAALAERICRTYWYFPESFLGAAG